MTKIGKAIKREIVVAGVPHTVTVSKDGVKLTRKGFRHGIAISWSHFSLSTARGD